MWVLSFFILFIMVGEEADFTFVLAVPLCGHGCVQSDMRLGWASSQSSQSFYDFIFWKNGGRSTWGFP